MAFVKASDIMKQNSGNPFSSNNSQGPNISKNKLDMQNNIFNNNMPSHNNQNLNNQNPKQLSTAGNWNSMNENKFNNPQGNTDNIFQQINQPNFPNNYGNSNSWNIGNQEFIQNIPYRNNMNPSNSNTLNSSFNSNTNKNDMNNLFMNNQGFDLQRNNTFYSPFNINNFN